MMGTVRTFGGSLNHRGAEELHPVMHPFLRARALDPLPPTKIRLQLFWPISNKAAHVPCLGSVLSLAKDIRAPLSMIDFFRDGLSN